MILLNSWILLVLQTNSRLVHKEYQLGESFSVPCIVGSISTPGCSLEDSGVWSFLYFDLVFGNQQQLKEAVLNV